MQWFIGWKISWLLRCTPERRLHVARGFDVEVGCESGPGLAAESDDLVLLDCSGELLAPRRNWQRVVIVERQHASGSLIPPLDRLRELSTPFTHPLVGILPTPRRLAQLLAPPARPKLIRPHSEGDFSGAVD